MSQIAINQPRQLNRVESRRNASAVSSRLGFALFILVNATLFIRPSELIARLDGWPIYELLIILCLLVSLPSLLKEMSPQALMRWPISFCVVGLLPVVALSHLSHLEARSALHSSSEFLKLVLYFLALVANVNSYARLRRFLLAILFFTIVITGLSLLQYHQIINLPQLTQMFQRQEGQVDEETGGAVTLARLCALGIFNNPNDLSRILVVAIIFCLFFLGERRLGPARFFWVLPLCMLAYANAVTYSRGGLLGLLGGLAILFLAKYGRFKAILLACVVLPLLLVAFSGRQTNISTDADTAHLRILYWRDGFLALHDAPVFGIGMGKYADIGGVVAHNSFVHAFVELGLVGGTLFVGLFYFAIMPLYRLRKYQTQLGDRELFRLRAFIIAALASYAIGLLSSSRCYEVPTYTLIGIAAVYSRLVAARVPKAIPPFNGLTCRRLIGASALVLAAHYVFVRFSA